MNIKLALDKKKARPKYLAIRLEASEFFWFQRFFQKEIPSLGHTILTKLLLLEIFEKDFNQIAIGHQVDIRLSIPQAFAFKEATKGYELTTPGGFLCYKIEDFFGRYGVEDKITIAA